jgi:hypothetical protein
MELILSLRQGETGPADISARRQTVQSRYVSAVQGRTPATTAMSFDGRRSRVVVFPSPELGRLGGIRVSCWVWVAGVRDRHTIIEGYLAFALFIEANGSLGGTVYDGFDWGGVLSEPGAVPLRRWVKIVFTYDGIDTCTLHLDGKLCAAEFSPLGLVQGVVWPYGISVGAWPDGDKRVFDGRIEELTLWSHPDGDPGVIA